MLFHERGEIRDRSFDSQAFRASGLNLVVSAIVHWNTVYLGRSVEHLRNQGRQIPDEVLKHISPLGWEHINLTGIYSWDERPALIDGFRPLRVQKSMARAGALHSFTVWPAAGFIDTELRGAVTLILA